MYYWDISHWGVLFSAFCKSHSRFFLFVPSSWYSGIFLTAIRVAGGALSAYFRLLSDKSLFKISEINGFVKYVNHFRMQI
jgi:hypothetical protein